PRHAGRGERLAGQPRSAHASGHARHGPRDGAGGRLRPPARNQDAGHVRAGRHAVGGQPAEGRAVALARDAAPRPDPPRADAGRGRRREVRDPRAHGRARARRRGHPHDLLGDARDPGDERQDRGDARGPDRGRAAARGGHAGGSPPPRPRRGAPGARGGGGDGGPRRAALARYKHELSAALAFALLLAAMAAAAPAFFSGQNLRDLALNNAPVLIVAAGMTLVILVGQIDISVGSQFAIASVAAGLLAKAGGGGPHPVAGRVLPGAGLRALTGAPGAGLGLPSIIVTLAMLVAWRDALRWTTEGAWVQDLPAGFQWFGLGQAAGQWLIVGAALGTLAVLAFVLRHLGAGRAVYAVGSDREAARLAGIEPVRVVFGVFLLMGALTGLAALLNAV